MCYYKRATFSGCNHTQWSAKPMRECQIQKDLVAGRSTVPCDTAQGHPLATIKIEAECAACRGQADKLDERLRRAKDIISVSKQTLIGADQRCRAILEDAGIEVPFSDDEGATPHSSPVSGTHTATTAASTVDGGSEGGGKEDSSAKEFLRKRSEQKDSRLCMR
ncbi:hypothetical protein PG994_010314 [Apiospora phragmitis]|uniref:Uncharacterized protein n=1 Tax=Apiospora phragmitis TaxID=2905665 RepID=A0ABR1TPJ9_9PEZI